MRPRLRDVALLSLCLATLCSGCGRQPTSPAPRCLADSLGPLNNQAQRLVCDDADACRRECRIGSAAACLGLATRLDLDPKTAAEAQKLFERACVLGSPSGCTNTAAMIWTREPSDEEATCAMRLFERACQVQVLAQSTGQPLIRVSDAIAEHTAAQWLKEAPKAATQFAAVQRVVDGTASPLHA